MFVGFQPTSDVTALVLDRSDSLVAVVCGVENDGQSRSSFGWSGVTRSSTAISIFLEQFVEIRRKILWNVHPREIRNVDVTDLEAGSDKLVA